MSGHLGTTAWCAAGLACAAWLAAGCGAARDAVVVYSPHGREVLGDYEKLFEAAHPGVDVQWLDMGANEVYSRVAAERARPACDVWWGAPSATLEKAAAEGLLAAYRPSWAEAVKPAHRDAEDRWYATYLSPLAILYNTNGMTREQAPKSWEALADPAWKGRVAIRKPLASGTMRTFIAAMIARAPSEEAGLAYLAALHANTSEYPESPNLLFDHLKKNPEKVSVWIMPDAILQRDRNGFPFGYVIPRDTPILVDGIAIAAGAPHPERAKQFYEFVTAREALLHQAQAYAKLPARSDIAAAELPPELGAQAIVPLEVDRARFNAMEAAWCARWEREVYRAGAGAP